MIDATSAPTAAPSPTPDPDRFAGLGQPPPLRLELSAKGASSTVAVRDDAGELVWRGSLDAGESQTVRVAGAATVVASNGGAVVASVNGDRQGPLGDLGEAVQRVIRPADPR